MTGRILGGRGGHEGDNSQIRSHGDCLFEKSSDKERGQSFSTRFYSPEESEEDFVTRENLFRPNLRTGEELRDQEGGLIRRKGERVSFSLAMARERRGRTS